MTSSTPVIWADAWPEPAALACACACRGACAPRQCMASSLGPRQCMANSRQCMARSCGPRQCMASTVFALTPVQVVRLCAKSREDVLSPCEHLTLHYQVGGSLCDFEGPVGKERLLQLPEPDCTSIVLVTVIILRPWW